MSDDRPDRVRPPKPGYYKIALQGVHRSRALRARLQSRGRDRWTEGVRILCYHRIADDGDELAVAPRRFRRQMELLRAFGATVVGLDEAAEALAANRPGRFISLTFDDGYRDFEDAAVPVLRELGLPATVFVANGLVSGTHELYWYERPPLLLDWDELRELAADPLFSVGGHTDAHLALPMLSDADAWREIAESRRETAERVGRPVSAFAYPAGLYTAREVRLAEQAGYRLAVTTDVGVNLPGCSLYTLRRTIVDRRDSIALFEAKLRGFVDEPWALRDLVRWRKSRERRGA